MAACASISCGTPTPSRTPRLPLFLLLWLMCGSSLFHAPIVTEAATEYNRYLAHLFQKYGSGGTMSFEGLEHLMYNLGLGQIEFEATHTIEEHYPNGVKDDTHVVDSPSVRTYFDQQSSKLLSSEAADVAAPQAAALKPKPATAFDLGLPRDEPQQDIVVKEKGIVLEFKEMHDRQHRHPKEYDATFDGLPLSSNVCLSPKALLSLVINHDDLHKRKLYKTVPAFMATGSSNSPHTEHDPDAEYNEFINNVQLTPVAFMKLCPALLAQIDQDVCVRPAPMTSSPNKKEMIWNAWIYATVSIFILSACGLLGILLVPLMKSVAYREILNFLVAIAVGTLSGDALMHLLPHALVAEDHGAEPEAHESSTQHGHDNTPVWICGCAFATTVTMYILENLLPLVKGDNHGHIHGHGHGHAHGPNHTHGKGVAPRHSIDAVATNVESTVAPPNMDVKEINVMLDEMKKDMKTPNPPLTPVAFMVIVGDGLHNLTDGLAIGAAFASDPVTGMATAFAVLCHELPHELGDFALLLQTGLSLRRAVLMNIVSSVLSFVGMAVGLLIAGVHTNMTQWIYAGTAGSFLYIALADLVPAMAAESKQDLKDVLIQVFGIIAGGVIMLLIAVNEEHLEALFQ